MNDSGPLLFIQTGCGDSRKVRDRLTNYRVAFTERNVTGDERAAKDLLATGMFVTPLLVFGGAKVIGFRPEALSIALGLQKG